MKRILLLGGSAQQVVAIETAKKLGIYTIVCDYLTDNPGQYICDKFYLVSTTDKDAVLNVAREEKVDGVLAYASDPAAPTAAYVADKLKLPTNPLESVNILCNKDKFRKFLSENGFYCPQAKGYDDAAEAVADIQNDVFEFPIIIKPVDSSGSKGVTILRSEAGLAEAVDFAFSFSHCKRIIIEQFIEMKHEYTIGGDIFIYNGNVIIWGLMNCFRGDSKNALVPSGEIYPVKLENADTEAVKGYLQRLVSLLGIHSGCMNVEVMIDKSNRVFIIDVGPRAGGNMIPIQLGCIFGVDIVEMSIKCAMGEEIYVEPKEIIPYCSTYVLHSDKSGIFKTVTFSDDIEKNIFKKAIYLNEGDKVEAFDNASKAVGIIFLKFDSMDEMLSKMKHIGNNIKIIFE